MVTRLEFNRFLMRQGAFKRFYANMSPTSKQEYLMYVKHRPMPCTWVMRCGFAWEDSKEGYWYWVDIQRSWEKHLSFLNYH